MFSRTWSLLACHPKGGGGGGPQTLCLPQGLPTAITWELLHGCRRLRSALLLLNILTMQTRPSIIMSVSQSCLVLIHSPQLWCSDGLEGAEIPAIEMSLQAGSLLAFGLGTMMNSFPNDNLVSGKAHHAIQELHHLQNMPHYK